MVTASPWLCITCALPANVSFAHLSRLIWSQMESGNRATLPRMSVLLLLLLPLLLGVMGSVGQVAAFPVPTEVTTYTSIADLGSLAQSATGIANQVWSTGSRLGSEFLRRGFAFLGVV
uniref:Uncharacterized protein n=2 Tax=Anopheles marajoara TaxID=58244 RepID=A0A2M4C3R7_9DIPT